MNLSHGFEKKKVKVKNHNKLKNVIFINIQFNNNEFIKKNCDE